MNKKIVLPSLFIFFACFGTAQQPAQDLLKQSDHANSLVAQDAFVQNVLSACVLQQKKEEEQPWWKAAYDEMRSVWNEEMAKIGDKWDEEKPRSARREVSFLITGAALMYFFIQMKENGK